VDSRVVVYWPRGATSAPPRWATRSAAERDGGERRRATRRQKRANYRAERDRLLDGDPVVGEEPTWARCQRATGDESTFARTPHRART
jgi:hypothetical protein